MDIVPIEKTTENHWSQVRSLIDKEDWYNNDQSVMEIRPRFGTTRVLFAVDKETKGNFWRKQLQLDIQTF